MSDDTERANKPAERPAETKLTATKQRWAREGRFLTGRTARPEAERLPPGQHLVRDWPVLDLGIQPSIARDRWQLDAFGAVEHPLVWDWPAFHALPQSQDISDIHCVTTWSRYDNAWEGVSTVDILAAVMPKPEAQFVILHSYDGYTTNLSIEDFAAPDAILAHSWQGAPLTQEHGGPVRLVVPRLYFWKSAKWLQRMEFTSIDRPSFWETRGYHNRGDPWAEQRYSSDD
jgi:DMSO/TMAO reductase YedYZ molybdopterin-dependent catalytic subunit